MNQYQIQLERSRRRKKQLIKRLVIASVIIVVSFGALLTYHLGQRSTYADKVEEYKQLTEEFNELEAEESELLEEIDLLNDDEYILEIARTNYFLSKKGELIFQVEEKEERSY